jgi:hypothetical protein
MRAEAALLAKLPAFTPLVEGYFQALTPNVKLGYSVTSDRYILGRLTWKDGPRVENLLRERGTEEDADASKTSGDQKLLDGLLQATVPDFQQLGPDRYTYKFVRRDFLGSVRCLVYDVAPRSSSGDAFVGRIYLEDRTWNIVRFTGLNPRVDALFSALRGKNSKFRIDSWRANVLENLWVPAYAYVEEVPPLGAPKQPVMRGQIRYWGYSKTVSPENGEFVDLEIQKSPSTADGREKQWSSPQQSLRQYEDQAEANVLARLLEAGFLAEPGDVEKKIEQVVTNLVVTNKLALSEPVHCRVLLTASFEALKEHMPKA